MKLHHFKNFFCSCLLVLILVAAPALADNGSGGKKSLLWEISGNGLSRPSYIYGTLHAICPDKFVLADVVKDKLKATEQLSLEVDMDNPDFMAELQQNLIMKDGGSLKSFYTEADYKILSDHFSNTMNLDIRQIDILKPFLLSSMLMIQFAECETTSYEKAFMALAQEQGKEIIGLETVKEQMSAFDKIPNTIQAAMLLEAVVKADESKAKYRQMVDLYLAQDLEALANLIKTEYKDEYQEFEEALINERNRNWIPAIEKEVKTKATFFAVGAGHLAGEEGVLELLRKKGYTVKPL